MKLWILALLNLSLVFLPQLSFAQIHMPSYKNLCEYDPDHCSKVGRVERGQLVVKRPRPELMEYYKQLRPLIIRIAAAYQIDPVTLVMAPLAENTMNVNIIDKIEDQLELNGQLDDDGRVISPALQLIYDKPMSIGPGQIYVSVAKHVEPLAAAIEHRPLRQKKQIGAALMTRAGALGYAAAIIRDAQDTYKAGGVDISKRPEILSTLYNIGKIKMRLSNARGRESYPNYFGYFVGLNYRYVQQALNLPSVLDAPAVAAR